MSYKRFNETCFNLRSAPFSPSIQVGLFSKSSLLTHFCPLFFLQREAPATAGFYAWRGSQKRIYGETERERATATAFHDYKRRIKSSRLYEVAKRSSSGLSCCVYILHVPINKGFPPPPSPPGCFGPFLAHGGETAFAFRLLGATIERKKSPQRLI